MADAERKAWERTWQGIELPPGADREAIRADVEWLLGAWGRIALLPDLRELSREFAKRELQARASLQDFALFYESVLADSIGEGDEDRADFRRHFARIICKIDKREDEEHREVLSMKRKKGPDFVVRKALLDRLLKIWCAAGGGLGTSVDKNGKADGPAVRFLIAIASPLMELKPDAARKVVRNFKASRMAE